MLGKIVKTAALTLLLVAVSVAETVPYGTKLTVRIDQSLSSGSASVGHKFGGSLTSDLVVDGKTLAKSGAPVSGKVTYAKSSGRLHAPGELTVRLTAVEIHGKMVPISTSAYRAKGKSHTKSNVTKIGGGAGAGALIGAIAGGGKGALIGAAVGGAAGTGVAAATGKQEAVIPAETAVTFTTTGTATVK